MMQYDNPLRPHFGPVVVLHRSPVAGDSIQHICVQHLYLPYRQDFCTFELSVDLISTVEKPTHIEILVNFCRPTLAGRYYVDV